MEGTSSFKSGVSLLERINAEGFFLAFPNLNMQCWYALVVLLKVSKASR